MTTDNYKKHTTTNPVQKWLIGRFYTTLFSVLKPLKVSSILDAGCGEGISLSLLQEQKIGKKLEGIDFLPAAIKIGKKAHPALTLKEGTIYDLPYKTNSFDLVMATEVLEHLEDPQKALSEVVRVSKKYVLLSVPNEPFFMGANLLRGKNIKRFGNDIEHINHWSFLGFEKFVTKEKLTVVKRKYPFPWTMLLLEKKV